MRTSMRRGFILVVMLIGAAVPVWGQQLPWVFYDSFESADTSGWWALAPAGETGQVTCFDESGTVIACTGTGQDGEERGGTAWPSPRFADNGDGTVTDRLTGLVWLKNANCFELRTWLNALADANGLASGACGLSDGSEAGDWRLPSQFELGSLLDLGYRSPALSNAAGTGQWVEGDAFSGVQSSDYWSSSSFGLSRDSAWSAHLAAGEMHGTIKTGAYSYVWPVRAGQSGWAPARVGATGQETCFNESGTVITCGGTGQDGDERSGMAWPNPRFSDNGDGSVTDMLTGLVWLKNADCFGARTWVTALADANGLASGTCGLSDGSIAGDWRLPSRFELESLLDLEYTFPALSNAAGTGQWVEGDAFSSVLSSLYWSSSSVTLDADQAWGVYLTGAAIAVVKTSLDDDVHVWPLRARH